MTVLIKTIPVDLDPNTRYAIRIRSINSFGVSSDWSEGLIVSTTDDAGAPSSPEDVSVSSYPRGILVRWTPVGDNDLAKYEIYVDAGAGDFIPSATTLVGIIAQSDVFLITKYWNGSSYASLAPGNAYSVRIRSVDAAGNASAYSGFVSTTAGYVTTTDIQDAAVTPVKLDRAYLPTAGGTMTGNLTTSSSDIIVTDATNEVRLTSTGTIELTNSAGPYIDFKNYIGDDYDVRIAYSAGINGLVITGNEVDFSGHIRVAGDLTVNGISLGLASLAVQPSLTNEVPILVQGLNGQSVALQQWASYTGSVLSYISSTGVFTGPGTGLILLDAGNLSQGIVPVARLSGTYDISVTGSTGAAITALQLATPRSITLSGDLSGTVLFDGSTNVDIAAAVIDDSHTHDTRYYTETEANNLFVNASGDTMTGALAIAATPVTNSEVANKLYVDTAIGGISDNILLAPDPLPQYHNDYRGDLRYPSKAQLKSLMGDLLYVGLFDPTEYDRTINTYPKPTWVPSGSINLIKNSSFEHDVYQDATPYFEGATPASPADSLADFWHVEIRGGDSTRSYTPAIMTDLFHHGNRSQKITITGTVGNTNKTSFGTVNTISVSPNTPYTLSAYGKTSGINKGRVSIRWLTSADVEISDSYSSYFSDTSFDRVTLTATSPANAAKCTIEFEIGGATPTVGDWIQIDAVQLEQSSTVSDYSPKNDEQYRHGMYWIVSGADEVGFIDTDHSGHWQFSATPSDGGDNPVDLVNGDWIICVNPNIGIDELDTILDVSDVLFQFIPYSTESFISAAITRHTELYTDPENPTVFTNPHPQYMTNANTDVLYAPVGHNHDDDLLEAINSHIRQAAISVNEFEIATPNNVAIATLTTVSTHGFATAEGINITGMPDPLNGSYIISSIPASNKISYALATPALYQAATPVSPGLITYDPHIDYLRVAEAELLYSNFGHTHDNAYEIKGSLAGHLSTVNPHPIYLQIGDALNEYAEIVHNHDGSYLPIDHTFAQVDEVQSTDGAGSSVFWIGSATPNSPNVGDLWVETFGITLTEPAIATAFQATNISATSMTISWSAWGFSVGVLELQLQRTLYADTGWASPTTLTVGASAVNLLDSGLIEKTQYRYRLRARNEMGWGYFTADITPTTVNGAPLAPTGLIATPGAGSISLSWNAVTDVRATNGYELFKNQVSQGYVSGATLTYNFTGLNENVAYTLGVRAWDNGDLPSNDGTVNSLSSGISIGNLATNNTAPPAPTGLTASALTHSTILLSWNAVTGTPDFSRYKVYLNSNYINETTSTSWTFQGLTGNTGYTVGVRSVDTSGEMSAIVNYPSTVTTSSNPDTTPPPTPSITSFKPENAYGQMWVRGSFYADAQSNPIIGKIEYRINGGSWTTYLNGTVSAGTYGYNVTTGAAGNTIEVRVSTTDSLGNTNVGSITIVSYTLAESPTLVFANASSSWRNTYGGQWNAAGNNRPYQGYYDNAAWNAKGCWFYGTTPQTSVSGKTLTDIKIWVGRYGCGYNAADTVKFVKHQLTTNPGNVSYYGTFNTSYDTASEIHTGSTLVYNESKAMSLPLAWGQQLQAGTWKGIGIYQPSGAPYMCLFNTSEMPYGLSGALEFYHLG